MSPQPQTNTPTPKAPARRDRRILPIGPDVRALLGLYLGLFRNYEEAAETVGVSKDTIAKYFEGNPNIAFYVFERMVEVLRERVTEAEIEEVLKDSSLDGIFARAKERNGQQIDNVMYEISPAMLRLLEFYTGLFPSRARASHKLDVNPRTFKAYLKGDIRSFPRRKFEHLVDLLKERGYSKDKLLEVAGVKNWDDLLSAKVRLETLNLSREDLVAEITQLFEQGTLKNKMIEKRLRNAANRLFGNFGNAVRATMKELEEKALERIETEIDKASFAGAFKEIRRLERLIQAYAMKERAITRSAGAGEKKRWKEEVLAMSQRKNKLKEVVFKALRLGPTAEKDRLPESEEDLALYSPESGYKPGDILLHPEYGLGHVLDIVEERQFVITFGPKVGEKTLVMNQRRGGPEFWNR